MSKSTKLLVIALLIAMLSTASVVEAQSRWMQWGTVTLNGQPAKNTLIIIELHHSITGHWIQLPHSTDIMIDSNGNWFLPIDAIPDTHSVFSNIRATAITKNCITCNDIIGSVEVPYEIDNLININIELISISGCEFCSPDYKE